LVAKLRVVVACACALSLVALAVFASDHADSIMADGDRSVSTLRRDAPSFSDLEVLDLVGLTSPPIARAGRSVPPELLTRMGIGHERSNLEYALQWGPDLVITTEYRMAASTPRSLAEWLIVDAMKRETTPYHVPELEIMANAPLGFARDDRPRR
jgi:hypothetical protein